MATTTDTDERERHRLLVLIEQLQREGCSDREIEATLRDVTGHRGPLRMRPQGSRRVDELLARLPPLRLWA